MTDKQPTHAEITAALRAQLQLSTDLLERRDLTPVQKAALEVVRDLADRALSAHDDRDRTLMMIKLAQGSLVRSEIARYILAHDTTRPELRAALSAMMLRRGEAAE
jgi:hypothetical protein